MLYDCTHTHIYIKIFLIYIHVYIYIYIYIRVSPFPKFGEVAFRIASCFGNSFSFPRFVQLRFGTAPEMAASLCCREWPPRWHTHTWGSKLLEMPKCHWNALMAFPDLETPPKHFRNVSGAFRPKSAQFLSNFASFQWLFGFYGLTQAPKKVVGPFYGKNRSNITLKFISNHFKN